MMLRLASRYGMARAWTGSSVVQPARAHAARDRSGSISMVVSGSALTGSMIRSSPCCFTTAFRGSDGTTVAPDSMFSLWSACIYSSPDDLS